MSGFSGAPAMTAPAELLTVREARIASWQGAGVRGDTGLFALSGFAARAVYEVPGVPDFSSPRFPDLSELGAGERLGRVAETQSRLVSALHTLGPSYGVSLRYHCARDRDTGVPRVRCFLVGRAFAGSDTGARAGMASLEQILRENWPAGYPLEMRDAGAAAASEPGYAVMTESRGIAPRGGVGPREIVKAGAYDPVIRNVLEMENVSAVCEVLKLEQALPAWHDPALCGFTFYYLPLPFSPGENAMVEVCRSLTEAAGGLPPGAALVLDVTLVPASPLTAVEREEVSAWSAVCEKWGRDQRVTVPGGLYSRPQQREVAADPHAAEAKRVYADILARYGGPQQRLFLFAARVALLGPGGGSEATGSATSIVSATAAAFAARALAPGVGYYLQTVTAVPKTAATFDKVLRSLRFSYVTPALCNEALWQHPEAPETLRRVQRLVTPAEAAPFFRLPIPGRDGCPGMALWSGMPVAATPPAGGTVTVTAPANVYVGRLIDTGASSFAASGATHEGATVRVEDLSKHALIVGTPGSGKTSLAFSLLVQLWRDHRVPFLVLEPAKTEYRALLDAPGIGEDLMVFTVGGERVSPFRLNPFEILPGVPVAEHIAALTACFQGAFSLPDPLPLLLDEALREVYTDAGWSEFDIGGEEDEGVEPPTMAALARKAAAVAERSRYRGDVAGNIRAALETRLSALLRGPKGRCFGARRSVPIPLLMDRPVVLELESLTDEEKSLAMMLLLVFVREHARATRRSGSKLRHVLLVEEAHNLIGREDAGGRNGGGADPKGTAIRFFTRMLAEMRALGEGMIIADQLPSALAPEAVKNTNLKVMHRLTARDDREALGSAMVLDEGQMEQAATLTPGISFVFQEGWPRSRAVQAPDTKAQLSLAEPPHDTDVRERMAGFSETNPEVRRAFLPYADCAAVCPGRCDGRLRERVERWASSRLPVIEEVVRRRCGKGADDPAAAALEVYHTGMAAAVGEAPAADGCALIHFVEMIYPTVAAARTDEGATAE